MAQPTPTQNAKFLIKSRILQQKRLLSDFVLSPIKKFSTSPIPNNLPLLAEHTSTLWNTENPLEQDLTAGKIQNLRIACKSLNRLHVPANQVFSFWKHIGKTKSSKGYVIGRELREGCIIPTMGGGICQFSNALYDTALKAGLEIVERHAHSQVIEGSLASRDRDATVFWNYIDLRFKSPHDLHIEVKLSKDQLILRLFGKPAGNIEDEKKEDFKPVEHIGNCYSCNISACFRNQQQTPETVRFGKTAALVDAYSPEFDTYLNKRLNENDHFFSPINAKKFKAHAYRWNLENKPNIKHATLLSLKRALKLRKISKQGKALQSTMLHFDEKLAETYAKKLDFTVSHVIISQNLLPHLWKTGALGGRTFDVLANRLPLKAIQSHLDDAAERHPESTTLADFRIDPEIIELEQTALAHANKIISPHREITSLFATRAEILEWNSTCANVTSIQAHQQIKDIYFPASPLGRKGIFELADTLSDSDLLAKPTLHILGRANEGEACPLRKIDWKQSDISQLKNCQLVILPAYVQHTPEHLIQALKLGIPVIATKACGLPPQDGLTILEHPSELAGELKKRLLNNLTINQTKKVAEKSTTSESS